MYMGAHFFADPLLHTHLIYVFVACYIPLLHTPVSYPCVIPLVEAYLFDIFSTFCNAPQIVFGEVFLGSAHARATATCLTAGCCQAQGVIPSKVARLKTKARPARFLSRVTYPCYIPLFHTLRRGMKQTLVTYPKWMSSLRQ